MAAFGWRKDRSLVEQLFAEPYRFDFFQAVSLLERLTPQAADVGESAPRAPEPVRFRSSLMAAFPASEIDHLQLGASGEAPEMTVNFLGLAGGFGPLPPPLSEHVLARTRRGDTAARDFLDVFNHRLIALMYRLRARRRPSLVRGAPDDSVFAFCLWALFGQAIPSLRGRLARPAPDAKPALSDRSLLHYAGLLAQAPRSLHGLERVLADYFGVAVQGAALQGRWLPIDPAEEMRLGRANSRLGGGAALGCRAWDQQAGLSLALGPMPRARFLDFLPGAPAYAPLSALVAFYVETPVEPEYCLLLRAEDVPGTRLGREHGARLGWTSFLTTKPRRTPGEVRLRPGVVRL